jgi:hypothetical protein
MYEYGTSKLYVLMAAAELQERLRATQVDVFRRQPRPNSDGANREDGHGGLQDLRLR